MSLQSLEADSESDLRNNGSLVLDLCLSKGHPGPSRAVVLRMRRHTSSQKSRGARAIDRECDPFHGQKL